MSRRTKDGNIALQHVLIVRIVPLPRVELPPAIGGRDEFGSGAIDIRNGFVDQRRHRRPHRLLSRPSPQKHTFLFILLLPVVKACRGKQEDEKPNYSINHHKRFVRYFPGRELPDSSRTATANSPEGDLSCPSEYHAAR